MIAADTAPQAPALHPHKSTPETPVYLGTIAMSAVSDDVTLHLWAYEDGVYSHDGKQWGAYAAWSQWPLSPAAYSLYGSPIAAIEATAARAPGKVPATFGKGVV